MKVRLIVALIAGALVSATLLMMDQLTGSELAWMDWEMPGIAAAYLFWGAAGSSVVCGVAVCWLVNALLYGLGAFAVLTAFKLLAAVLPSKKSA